jgi:hypothetical protein
MKSCSRRVNRITEQYTAAVCFVIRPIWHGNTQLRNATGSLPKVSIDFRLGQFRNIGAPRRFRLHYLDPFSGAGRIRRQMIGSFTD